VTDGAGYSAGGLDEFKPSQINLNEFEIKSNPMKLHSIEKGPSMGQKFQVKYGWKYLEIMNNFPYRNFSRFEMEFELEIRELL
jgi:hypothetical protein